MLYFVFVVGWLVVVALGYASWLGSGSFVLIHFSKRGMNSYHSLDIIVASAFRCVHGVLRTLCLMSLDLVPSYICCRE